MKFPSPESTRPAAALSSAEPSGLSPEHKAALSQASEMIAHGRTVDDAVAHLVANGMPRLVAKVLVKQLDKRG